MYIEPLESKISTFCKDFYKTLGKNDRNKIIKKEMKNRNLRFKKQLKSFLNIDLENDYEKYEFFLKDFRGFYSKNEGGK